MLLKDSFCDCDVTFANTLAGLGERSGVGATIIVPDFNVHQPVRTVRGALAVAHVVLKVKPDVVVSTGAAPGLIALAVGKLVGARTVWIDSIANAERLSLSGRLAKGVADLWLTQWEHLAAPDGPQYLGAVL